MDVASPPSAETAVQECVLAWKASRDGTDEDHHKFSQLYGALTPALRRVVAIRMGHSTQHHLRLLGLDAD